MLLTHTAARGFQHREPLAFSGRKDQALTASKTVQARYVCLGRGIDEDRGTEKGEDRGTEKGEDSIDP